jgi:FkbM family methyltransferase
VLTRALLHPRVRHYRPFAWAYVQLYVFGKRLTERRELETLRTLIAPGMVIADIGANAGFYTLQMASLVGPTGRILAFEPDAYNFGLLRTRLAHAGVTNVEAYQVAIGDAPGRATLYCSAYNRADNRLHQSHTEAHVEANEVDVRPLDDFVDTSRTRSIDAIKVDVQGAEAQVLRGARSALDRGLRWIWLEFSPPHLEAAGTDPRQFLGLLQSLGMDILEVGDDGDLRQVKDFQDYIRRIGVGYGDLLLRSTSRAHEEEHVTGNSYSAVGTAADGRSN